MDRQLIDLIAGARAAVIMKDDGGFCVYANRREEDIRGVRSGELVGKHITELVDADPTLVERAFEQFKRERAWAGQFRTHDSAGNPLRLRTYNFVHCEWDGTLLYASFAYLLGPRDTSTRPATLPDVTLAAEDLCTAQLCADGYSDEELAVLFGVPLETVRNLVARFIQRIGANSRTEACIRALKSGLVA